VNEFVWEAYWRLYGGGPAIVRQSLDIYSEPVNTLLVEPGADLKFYRDLEKTEGELLGRLILKQAKNNENLKN